MELEFDKEMDTLLRQARGGSTRTVGEHVDADAIAAFAENALPVATRKLYTVHFADCDRCRKLLSSSILLNETAASTAAAAEVAEPVSIVGGQGSWLFRRFRAPGLAAAMAGLVLIFGGVLGYMIFQSRPANSDVAMSKPAANAPINGTYTPGDLPSAAAPNMAANTAAPTINGVSNSAVGVPGPMTSAPANVASKPNIDTGYSLDGIASTADRSPATEKELGTDTTRAEAKPPAPSSRAASEDVKLSGGNPAGVAADAAVSSSKDDDAVAKRKVGDEIIRRDSPLPPAKTGPVRSVGPVQSQNAQAQTNIYDMSVTRRVGGKTFANRDGGWVDLNYRGQAFIYVRRASDAYKALDSGLRSISEQLDGAVTIVWKGKAYRIQ